jgi:hypothetical protein
LEPLSPGLQIYSHSLSTREVTETGDEYSYSLSLNVLKYNKLLLYARYTN